MKYVCLYYYVLLNLILCVFKSNGKQANTCWTVSVLFDDCDCYESMHVKLKCEEEKAETIEFLNEYVRLNSKQLLDLSKFISIKINNKKIPHLEAFLFQNFSLNILDLSSNEIEDLSNQTFNGVNNLSKLVLANNRLKSLNNIILSFSNSYQLYGKLTSFDVSFNQIEQIDMKFERVFDKLISLNLNSNRIKFIVDEAFRELVALEELYLSANRLIINLSDAHFVGLNNMKVLQLNENAFKINEIQVKNLHAIKTIYLTDSKVTTFSFSNLTSLNEIDLKSNQIEWLKKNQLVDLNYLKKLILKRNKISHIEEWAFESLVSLDTLDLSFNELSQLAPNMFFNMIKLKTLFLNSNRIKSIESFTFDAMINLFDLNLSDNQITWLESNTFCYLSGLGFLDLNKNKIRFYTKESFKCLEKLIFIYIFYGQIRFDAFEYLTNLHKLTIESVYIPLLNNQSINGMANLDFLIIYRSRIIKMDSYFVQGLAILKEVIISDNIIDEFGEYLFYNLTLLTKITFTECNLKILKANWFIDLPNLKTLVLKRNKLIKLEEGSIKNSLSIEELDLSLNSLNALETIYFGSDLFNLRILNLSFNNFHFIKPGSFEQLTNLETLDLSENYLNHLPHHLFVNQGKLKRLYLHQNRLKFINEQTLNGLLSLKSLNLENNMLQSIKNSFIGLVSLRKLKLSQNRLRYFESFAVLNDSNQIVHNYLDLSRNCLKSIRFATTQFSYLSFFDLSYNMIEVIEASDFEFFRSIEVFNISNNYLKLFEISAYVEILLLNMSNINMQIDLNLFETNNRIVSLDLSSNTITSSFFNFSTFLPHLTHLRIYNSLILNESLSQFDFSSLLHFDEFQLDNVQGFRIEMNRVSAYDSCPYSQIKSLILSNQELKHVDWIEFFKLNETIELDLSHNQISVVKAQNFKAMISLQRLDLSFNRIVEIEKGTFKDLNVLEYIDLRQNDLKEIDSTYIISKSYLFGSNRIKYVKILKNAHYVLLIDYSHNNLMEFAIQPNIDSIFVLQVLYLNHNLLTNITNNYFYVLSSLQKIRLDHNQICSIEKNSFQSINSLEYLTLNNNQLDYLDVELFKFMRGMKHLNLSSNRLSFIHSEQFSYMIDLRELDLSNNLIYQIGDYAFINLIRLNGLYLNGNENFTLNESSLFGLSAIKSIHLSFSTLLNKNNLKYLTNVLRPRLSKTIHSRKYYESIFIQYFFDNSFNQSESFILYECELVILFFRLNLNLNLKTAQSYSLFVENCLKMNLSLTILI